MVRWYDHVLSMLALIFIVNVVVWGFLVATWWGPVLAGLLSFMVWEAWDKPYTAFRIKQERRNRIRDMGL